MVDKNNFADERDSDSGDKIPKNENADDGGDDKKPEKHSADSCAGGGSGGGAEGSGSDKNITNEDRSEIHLIGRKSRDIFFNAIKNEIKITLNAEYDNFDPPPEDNFVGSDTVIDVVFRSSKPTIYPKDLSKYSEVQKKGIKQSRGLRAYQKEVDRGNKIIRDTLNRTKTVYRGMSVEELGMIANNGGKVGLGKKKGTVSAAIDDFAPSSIDTEVAETYAKNHAYGIMVEMDVSEMEESDYEPVRYEVRRDVRVYDPKRPKQNNVYQDTYRPDEKFGGSHAAQFMKEAEVHLKRNSIPKIREITIIMNDVKYTKVRDEMAEYVKKLKDTHGSDITINYTPKYKERYECIRNDPFRERRGQRAL